MPENQDAKSEVESLVQKMNAAWLEGRYDELHQFIDDDVVMRPPGMNGMLVGREGMVDSFRKFMQEAKVHAFSTKAINADIIGDTAVVNFSFQIDYEYKGERYDEGGTDLLVWSRRSGNWRVVWRTQLPATESSPA